MLALQPKLEELSGPELVDHYNNLAASLDLKPVKRFSDRSRGIQRCRKLMEQAAQKGREPAAAPRPEKPKLRLIPSVKTGGRLDLAPKADQRPPRLGTKREQLLQSLLAGATLEECMEEIGWDRRTCLDGIRLLNKRLGWGIREGEDGRIFAYS